jgi:hydroxymethylbilane synthase
MPPFSSPPGAAPWPWPRPTPCWPNAAEFPNLEFELKIIKTTGDKLQTADPPLRRPAPRALFTKELEAALLQGRADLAVHSLKDLPTDLPGD